MAIIKEKVRLVFSDLSANSYKYYDSELHDDGRVISSYGVVGARNPQSKDFGCIGENGFRKKIREKERKGYEHAKVIIDGSAVKVKGLTCADILGLLGYSRIVCKNDSVSNTIVK